VFAVGWMVDVLRADFALEQLLRREQLLLYDGDESNVAQASCLCISIEDVVACRDGTRGILQSVAQAMVSMGWRSAEGGSELHERMILFIENLSEWVGASSLKQTDQPREWLRASMEATDQNVPWEECAGEWGHLEWNPYALSLNITGDRAKVLAVLAMRRLARAAFNLWMVRVGQASPAMAVKCAQERLSALAERSHSQWERDFILSPQGHRILGDLLMLMGLGSGKPRHNFVALVGDALDAYMMAGAPDDYEKADALIPELRQEARAQAARQLRAAG
jgi:hypothetical protein